MGRNEDGEVGGDGGDEGAFLPYPPHPPHLPNLPHLLYLLSSPFVSLASRVVQPAEVAPGRETLPLLPGGPGG